MENLGRDEEVEEGELGNDFGLVERAEIKLVRVEEDHDASADDKEKPEDEIGALASSNFAEHTKEQDARSSVEEEHNRVEIAKGASDDDFVDGGRNDKGGDVGSEAGNFFMAKSLEIDVDVVVEPVRDDFVPLAVVYGEV